MERVQGNIHVDYPDSDPAWKVIIGHRGQFPLSKGQKVPVSIVSITPPLDDRAFGLRPLWIFLDSDPQRYEVQFERDGSCRISYTWPLRPDSVPAESGKQSSAT